MTDPSDELRERDEALTTSICLPCGICCDGTLFSEVPLVDEEAAPLRAIGIELITKGEATTLSLPCAAFDGCCTIYADRPMICGVFACALHKRHAAGEVDTAEAEAVIAKTIALRDIVRQCASEFIERQTGYVVPTGERDTRTLAGLIKEVFELLNAAADVVAAKEAHSLMLLYISALDQRLTKFFRD